MGLLMEYYAAMKIYVERFGKLFVIYYINRQL